MSNSDPAFLDTEAIAAIARDKMPAYYSLHAVRFDFDSSSPGLPKSLEIRIEYTSVLAEELQGLPDDIAAFQAWSNPLIEKIRSQWPKEAIRISFSERLAPNA